MNRSLLNRSPGESRGGFISTSALILLFVAGIAAVAALRRWDTVLSLATGCVAVFILVGNGFLARWLARSLQEPAFFRKPQDFGGVSVIVLLGDGNIVQPNSGEALPGWLAYSRIERAGELYRSATASGAACRVIVTGDDSSDPGAVKEPVYVQRLRALGVPAGDIRVEGKGRNTYRQAELTSEILKAERCDRIFMVTSGLHMKRALRYFLNFGVSAIPVASDYVTGNITLLPLGSNFAIADIALHQYAGLARLRIYNALGWNK
ncbi:YdcF family protein [Opitutus terrae]|uniref:DUF218 domain-containing protein n=1 Tax=Opitutus terrae (strain DSM 11246 / JCM 15787 / PB90-1) TaxID=452637 RepID=B1ZQ24_OPITP|nr:YdcF family protein [Opitutus terrae]ACB77743.1 protein of unknown function DUF218 [Opitutus terrae PB90-1]